MTYEEAVALLQNAAEWVQSHLGNHSGDAHRCWADSVGVYGHRYDCYQPATTDIGLCDDHYEEIIQRDK